MHTDSSEQMTERWFSQRWIFDAAISVLGIEPFTGGSLTRGYESIGIDVLEVSHELRARVKKFADITRECKRVASSREAYAREAESEGHLVTARDNYFTAAVFYGCARWPIWDDRNPDLLELTNKITECYQKYASFSDHFVKRLEIHFEGKNLFAYLHLPPDRKSDGQQVPCVIVVPGMDTFKEELVRLYSDKFLQRGFAVLAIDGPGQGETLARGLKLTTDNFDRAGKAVMDQVISEGKESGIDKGRIGIFAASFGTYWGPRIMAFDQRYVAGSFSNICHEPHMRTIFTGTLPAFKARHMWMTGINDENEFEEEYCKKLSLNGIGERITKQPIFIAAGSDDPLSPIEYTYDFFKSIKCTKKKLLVYEGEEHRIGDPLLPARIGDFMDDAFKNKEVKGGAYFLDRGVGWKTIRPFTPPG
ncbi:MAG: alpha/beta hydrolase family protein [Nitrososphaerales archaeon]